MTTGKQPITMPALADAIMIEPNAQIPTWFGVGGRADRLARPRNIAQLKRCIELDPASRILGVGANLLVDDDGVVELVVTLSERELCDWDFDAPGGLVMVMAGANLPRLILEACRRGRAGLEGLGGIPATVGGAARMNAGGTFGEFGNAVRTVHAIDRSGRDVRLTREQAGFGYRRSNLGERIVVSVELELPEDDPKKLRDKLKEVMEYKKRSQPMAERSAGCVFKNPTLTADLHDVGAAGQRVSAGMLIDRAGCKGLGIGGASISRRHANFVVTSDGAGARDVIELVGEVQRRVLDAFGVGLEPEIVVWRREQ
jgi:UDP-N-acetylmuramate dehydrogenase